MLNEEAIGTRARLKLAEDVVGNQPGDAMRLSSFLESIQRKGRLSEKGPVANSRAGALAAGT